MGEYLRVEPTFGHRSWLLDKATQGFVVLCLVRDNGAQVGGPRGGPCPMSGIAEAPHDSLRT